MERRRYVGSLCNNKGVERGHCVMVRDGKGSLCNEKDVERGFCVMIRDGKRLLCTGNGGKGSLCNGKGSKGSLHAMVRGWKGVIV